MDQVVDIIESFINNISFAQDVISHSDNGINTTIEVADIYHARAKLIIDVDGSDYEVVSVTEPGTIVVSGVIADPLILTLPDPYYFHGTPYATNSHLSSIEDWRNKTPFIYLLEIIRESFQGPESVIEREADIRLFFLDNANFADWTTDQHYTLVINGQRRLLEKIVYEMKRYYRFGLIENYDIYSHAKFGVYTDMQGHTNSVFDEELSGVELRINLPILYELKCEY